VVTGKVSYNVGKATCNVTVERQGHSQIESKGVVWGLYPGPTVDGSAYTDEGMGGESFTSIISGLEYGVTYYVRAYATNNTGTAYGNEISFVAKTTEYVSDPCSVAANQFTYPGGNIQLSSNYISGTNISANGSAMSIDFDFTQTPQTGKYVIVSGSPEESDECYIHGAFTYNGGFRAYAGDTVYVNIFSDDSFSVSFCNVKFNYYDAGATFYADCNATVE